MKNDFKGTGWKFPVIFNQSNEVSLISNEENIKQSIFLLLSTSLKERIGDPEFGINLNEFLFVQLDEGLGFQIKNLLLKTLQKYEPRVVIDDIEIQNDFRQSNQLNIIISYTVKDTNSRSNMVFPYYIDEANLIDNGFNNGL